MMHTVHNNYKSLTRTGWRVEREREREREMVMGLRVRAMIYD